MRKVILFPFLFLTWFAVSGASCVTTQDILGGIGSSYTNPVGAVNIYQVKLVYAASQELALEYQDKCFGNPPGTKTVAQINADPVLKALCKRRVSRYRAMKLADDKAYRAIRAADNFVAQNPTGSALSYVNAAWAAVSEYKALASK